MRKGGRERKREKQFYKLAGEQASKTMQIEGDEERESQRERATEREKQFAKLSGEQARKTIGIDR